MILGVSTTGVGVYVSGWRHPSVTPESLKGAARLSYYLTLAKLAEEAKMHFMFFADSPVVKYQFNSRLLSRTAQPYFLEPFTLASALAPFTTKIGLVVSASTTYNEPYNVARMLGSLDHLSEGRAAWNVVTSFDPFICQNFSQEALLAKDLRYDRAEDFVRIVRGLWDSWEDDAFIRDQSTGQFVDPAKMHFLNFKSANFQVRGPLNLERSPQGHPVVFLAGSSEDACNLAAETADAMFTAQPNIEGAQKFYKDVKARLARFGREPCELSILPGLQAVVGRTMAEAKEKHEYLRSFIDSDYAISYLSSLVAIDLSGFPLDEPPPPSLRGEKAHSRVGLIMDIAEKEGLSLGEIAIRFADQYGHSFLVGDPITIADELQKRFESRAADGFVLMPTHFPEGLSDFTQRVIPELQSRGLFRNEYDGVTLRDNLGLIRPPHRNPCTGEVSANPS